MKALLHSIMHTDADTGVTIPLRLALGTIFFAHGAQKLFGWFDGPGLEGTAQMFTQMGLQPGLPFAFMAGCGEFFGGLMVLLGLFTRIGALSLATVMAVAMIQVHAGHFFAADNGIEFPLALFAIALALLIEGGGLYSVDALLDRRTHRHRPAATAV